MKKTIICLLLAACGSQNLSAQDRERAVQQGNNSVNLYYGLNLSKAFYKSVLSGVDEDIKYGGIGPIGIVYEHLMTDVVGLGAEVGYSSFSMTYKETDANPTTGNLEYYNAKWQFATLRAMVRLNFHFINNPNFDMYALISAGYRHLNASYTFDSPYYSDSYHVPNFIPFGIKPGLGMRYFFTDNIGLNLELAAGTPVLCGGLSLRF
jgi:opacity protein-like surface antigen